MSENGGTLPLERRLYEAAIHRTAEMARDERAQDLARAHGLQLLSLTWEDTARYHDSAVGPNISDMTIQVHDGERARCMPVIRYPNFSDRSGDLDPRDFTLLVGNHRGEPLRRISLDEFLRNPAPYLSNPGSWPAERKTLWAERDERVLVSAQACLLPVPRRGKATFNPVLFNYQTHPDDPAVLTILATREGTSVTVIDNVRDGFGEGSAWGQRLVHNVKGERASLTGERLSDFGSTTPTETVDETEDALGLSLVLLIQVPLRQRERKPEDWPDIVGGMACMACMPLDDSDLEVAVIGHGELERPFTEIGGFAIERDPDYPVRVTVQFYKATSNGVVTPEDIAQIHAEIERVYAGSDAVGSLVTGGSTGRVTEYEGSKVQPADWWERFWAHHERNTGDSRAAAIRKLIELLGPGYVGEPVTELYLRDLLRD
jgi:hypothetical protein